MDNKPLFDRIDQLLTSMSDSIEQIRFALLTLQNDPQLLNDLQNPDHPINRSPLTPTILRHYMRKR